MDNEYLKKNIGQTLIDAVTACSTTQPKDPVDFIGRFLINADQKGAVKVAGNVSPNLFLARISCSCFL